MKRTLGEKVFNVFNILFFLLVAVVMILPMATVVKRSLDLGGHGDLYLTLIPQEFSIAFYQMVFSNQGIYRPFLNSIFVTFVGTVLAILVNSMGAYTLTQKWLRGSRFFVYFLVIVPMVFGGGGLVIEFLYYKTLGLYNRMAVLILPSLASGWTMILMREYFLTIPVSLPESARLDGAGEFLLYRQVIMPMSKSMTAAMSLFTGVGFWNSWMNALIYLNDAWKYTFPVKLRSMLFYGQNSEIEMEAMARSMGLEIQEMIFAMEGLSSAMIVVATLPVLIAYPYLQKHFAAGVRLGAIKG